MEKNVVDMRVKQMEGVTFRYGAHVGGNLPAETLLKEYDAVALTAGAEASRDLLTPGRELKGIHFAMDFLPQQNRRGSGEPVGPVEPILATGTQSSSAATPTLTASARRHSAISGSSAFGR
jgi:glutamate synthase (NADPH/NADH) small chain